MAVSPVRPVKLYCQYTSAISRVFGLQLHGNRDVHFFFLVIDETEINAWQSTAAIFA